MQADTSSSDSPGVRQIRITGSEAGQRLDNFLSTRLKGVPRTRLYRIIRRGEVRVNGSRSRPATRLQAGDLVRVPPVRVAPPREAAAVPEALSNPADLVLYQDADILVIDKPAGVAVHGGSGIRVGVIEALKRSQFAGDYLELGHRLDRETSGCLVLARSRAALLALHRLFRRDTDGVIKRYTALLHGEWHGGHTRIEAPLQRYRDAATGQSRMRASGEGQRSASVIETDRMLAGATLVTVTLETGRMHQARVHCRQLGHPILGDSIYGDFSANRQLRQSGLARLFLHAGELTLPHPVRSRSMTFRSPLSEDLRAVLGCLRTTGGDAPR